LKSIDKLKLCISVNIKFNDKYGLQYFEPDAYNRLSEQLSLMRKNKEIDFYEREIISKMFKHYYKNYYKIKDLENLEPRRIAQAFIGKKNIRKFIFNRDKKCLKCGRIDKLQIDHIIPVSKGGENKVSNLQTLCNTCNSIKRDNFKDYRNGGR
jgi:hypothetical protein